MNAICERLLVLRHRVEGNPVASVVARLARRGPILGLALAALTLAGCQTPSAPPITEADRKPYLQVGIQPGDVVRATFPAAPTMNMAQQVQSDGTIALPLGGTVSVKGKTVDQVQKELLEIYGPQLVVQEVSVTVESSGFPVYVSGAVSRPGRVQCRQSMTLLEAIIEAGGFLEGRANLKKVKVVRLNEDGTTQTYLLDLKSVLKGEMGEPFYLRPSDVVYVPERFSFY